MVTTVNNFVPNTSIGEENVESRKNPKLGGGGLNEKYRTMLKATRHRYECIYRWKKYTLS